MASTYIDVRFHHVSFRNNAADSKAPRRTPRHSPALLGYRPMFRLTGGYYRADFFRSVLDSC